MHQIINHNIYAEQLEALLRESVAWADARASVTTATSGGGASGAGSSARSQPKSDKPQVFAARGDLRLGTAKKELQWRV